MAPTMHPRAASSGVHQNKNIALMVSEYFLRESPALPNVTVLNVDARCSPARIAVSVII
jgi:hypothetical protein